jgi:hypothetical protein
MEDMTNNRELRPPQTEIQLGVCGPQVSDAQLKRIQAEVDAEVTEKEYNQARLEIEERRAVPAALIGRRRRMQQRIIDNVILESPHRHYFVRKPGL